MRNINRLRQWYLVGNEEACIENYSSWAIKTLKEAKEKQANLRERFPEAAADIRIYKCYELFSCVEVNDDGQ